MYGYIDDYLPADSSDWILEDFMADAATKVFTDFLGLDEFALVSDAGQMHLIYHSIIISFGISDFIFSYEKKQLGR
jgi:hypothetical protein